MRIDLRAAVLCLVSLASAVVPAAQVRAHKLSGELAIGTEEDILAFHVTDEGYVVFLHVASLGWEPPTLHTASAAGGPSIPLGTISLNSTAIGLTPDGMRVVFEGRSQRGVFIVPVNGGTPRRIGSFGAFGSSGTIEDLVISPDGVHVVYHERYTDSAGHASRLYSARLDGPLTYGRIDGNAYDPGTSSFAISPDSSRVVYQADGGVYSVPIDGSQAPVRLSDDPTATIVFSPDSQLVVISAGTSPPYGLYSVPIHGGVRVHLNPGSSFHRSSSATPRIHSGFVYFLAEDGAQLGLHRTPIDGSGPLVRLNPSHAAFSGAGVHAFQLLPGASHVVYRATVSAGKNDELFRVPTDGSQSAVALGGTFVAGGGLAVGDAFVLSPDGSRLVFVADRDVDDVFELYVAPSDGASPAQKLSPPMPPGADVRTGVRFTVDGRAVLFRSNLGGKGRTDLFITGSAAPGPSYRLNAELPVGGEVHEFVVGPGGQRAFYRAEGARDGVVELYAVPLATPGASYPLNAPFQYRVVGDVMSFTSSPDGRHVVYHAQRIDDSIPGLHAIALNELAPEVDLTLSQLSVSVLFGVSDVLGYSSSGALVYATRESADAPLSVKGIFASALDGSPGPVQLADKNGLAALSPDGEWVTFLRNSSVRAMRADGGTIDFEIGRLGPSSHDLRHAPRGGRVIYVTGPLSGPKELYSTRVDGSQPALRVSGPMAPGGNVVQGSPHFTPDGSLVVYVADASVDEQFELFRATSDGSVPAQRLSAPLPVGGDVYGESVRVTPDGTRAVYVADQEIDGVLDLYVVPLDASGPARRLSNAAINGVIRPQSLVVSDRYVAYFGEYTLACIAPLDGTSPPVLLSAAAPTHIAPRFTPDGSRLLFVSGVYQGRLFSKEVGVSGPSVKLSRGLPADAAVASFQLSADGTRVVYHSYDSSGRNGQLHWVPVAGGALPQPLLPGLAADRHIKGWQLLPDGNRVLVLCDGDVKERTELYQSFLVPPHRAR